jgi:hypothetical protein
MKPINSINLIFRGITFDNWTEEEAEYGDGINPHHWSGICQSCLDKHPIEQNLLDDGGSGTCDIKGCSGEADYYIDFVDSELEFIQVPLD